MAEFTEVMKQKERMCGENDCAECKLSHENNRMRFPCKSFISKFPQEAEEIIMAWAKEHPIKTNADKFREVFGINVDVDLDNCAFSAEMCKKVDYECKNCEHFDFWNREYVEPKNGETE